jgi:PadR family transcriptional regulator PadR
MEPTQVLKGMLDTAVLGALSREPTYGYELVTRLRAEGFAEIGDASVYGTLRRLHRSGFLTSEVVESEVGPRPQVLPGEQGGSSRAPTLDQDMERDQDLDGWDP